MLFVNLNDFEPRDYKRVQEAVEFLKTTDLTKTP